MPSEALRADEPSFVGDDEDIDELLAAHGGDVRAAISDCLRCIAVLQLQVSRGFVRHPLAGQAPTRTKG